MKRLLAVALLSLAMPASGAGQVVPAPDVRVPDVRVNVQQVQVPDPDRGPLEAMMLADRGAEIGVTIRDIDPADLASQKAAGVLVEQVRPGSPAATAGLRAADLVVSFDGERIRSSRQFSRLVQETPPGRTVTATIVRDGRRSDVSITPAALRTARRQDNAPRRQGRDDPGNSDRDIIINRGRDVIIDRDALRERLERDLGQLDGLNDRFDMPEFNFEFPGPSARGRLGVGVADLTAQLAAYFGAKEGVLVTTVTEGTPASSAGLKAGDVIVMFNGETVRNRVDLQRAVGRVQADAAVSIGIVRDRKQSDVTMKLEGPRRTTRRQA